MNFNLIDSMGNTPLSVALTSGMQHIVPLLIQGECSQQLLNGTNNCYGHLIWEE
jgi:ankyrin repeat protein